MTGRRRTASEKKQVGIAGNGSNPNFFLGWNRGERPDREARKARAVCTVIRVLVKAASFHSVAAFIRLCHAEYRCELTGVRMLIMMMGSVLGTWTAALRVWTESAEYSHRKDAGLHDSKPYECGGRQERCISLSESWPVRYYVNSQLLALATLLLAILLTFILTFFIIILSSCPRT